MRLVITSQKANELKLLAKSYMLTKEGRIFTLGNSTIELQSVKRTLSKEYKTIHILTDVELQFYYPVLKRWNQVRDDFAEDFIEETNFYRCRERWLVLHEALNANGLSIIKTIPETIECTGLPVTVYDLPNNTEGVVLKPFENNKPIKLKS